jgi:hypothetical protein
MTDAERALAVLIHDVRTPLGVAHGYVRLIRADKLPSPDDRERALAGTQDALARISRLCQDAGAFLDDPPNPAAGRAPVAQLTERVAAALTGRGIAVSDRTPFSGSVAVGSSVDRAADAIATLIGVRAGRTPGASASMTTEPGALQFVYGPAGPGLTAELATGGQERPFDPWQASAGLSVAVAYRFVTALGGRVWTARDGLALALSLPMEIGNE